MRVNFGEKMLSFGKIGLNFNEIKFFFLEELQVLLKFVVLLINNLLSREVLKKIQQTIEKTFCFVKAISENTILDTQKREYLIKLFALSL